MDVQALIEKLLAHARGMWRYRWWMVAAAWLLAVPGCLIVYSLPNVYQASTRVFVDTNSLLKPLMSGLTASEDPMKEVDVVAKAVLTRPNLQKVALKTDLDLRARTPEQSDALITDLQRRVKVSGGRDNIFTIEYQDPSREKARAVVAAMLDAFVEGALNNQGDDAQVTEKALANEIENHEQRLRDSEETLAKFKQQNLGYMPGEYGDYYSRLQAAMGGVSASQEKVKLLTQRRDELQRQIQGEEPVFGIMASQPGQATTGNCAQDAQIAKLESDLAALRVQYTDKHPRLVSLRETIDTLKKQCAADIETARSSLGQSSPTSAAAAQPLEQNPVYQSLKIQLSGAEVDLAEARTQLAAQQDQVAQLKRDVDRITEVEAKLKQLSRDYDVVQSRHKELLKRWEELQSKKRIDPVTDNVQFRRIEPPFALADPVGPQRALLLAGVLIVAVGGGLAVAFALNQLNPVFFTRASLGRVVPFPVLGSITMILTPAAAAKRRRAAFVWAAACAGLVVAVVIAMVFANPASSALRVALGGVGV
jgi:polysaccharide chain length determinant protein (PEP-CTERM system associated)